MPPLRTAVYIDGYNLYYGRLRGTPFKWLDVVDLFVRMCRSVEPRSDIVSVCFFTAPVLPKFARHGHASMKAQNEYHRALEAKYPTLFRKILGSHVYEKNGTELPVFEEGQPFDREKKVRVWRLIEKKSDVSLALTAYRDAVSKRVDQTVLVTNDTDAEPLMEALATDSPDIRIGVITPRPEPTADKKGRPANAALSRRAHWTRTYIRDDELIQSLLPDTVPTRKSPAKKPEHW